MRSTPGAARAAAQTSVTRADTLQPLAVGRIGALMVATSTNRVVVLGSFVHAHWWSMPRLPVPGESCLASSLSSELGGKGLNVAVGLRRLGADVVLLLGVGRDPAADALRALLDQEGIPDTHIHSLADTSGHGAGWIDAAGENSIVVFPGANVALGPREVARAADEFRSAALVYGQLEVPQATVLAAFTQARQWGVKTVLNASPMHTLDAALLAVSDILVLNWAEACQLMGRAGSNRPDTLAACAELLQTQVRTFALQWTAVEAVVVTLGALGSVAFSDGGGALRIDVQAGEVLGQVGDSAGAGDAFSAGLCRALARGQPLHQALRLANACGAAVAAKAGVLAHLPGWDQLKDRGYLPHLPDLPDAQPR